MKYKTLAGLELLIIIFLVALLFSTCMRLKRPEVIERIPEAPGESTIAYEPLPPPKFSLEDAAKVAKMMSLVTPEIEKVTEDIYLARGFALGSVAMIITREGLVIVDTTESPDAAQEILKKFRKITDKPVKYIIYTHGHRDHLMGSEIFYEPGVEVISTRDLIDFTNEDYDIFAGYTIRARSNQSGRAAPEYAMELPVKSPVRLHREEKKFIEPTITFDREYAFELGGKRIELYHTWGETWDHLMVWMPEEKALFCGDLYYASFPNLSTPMLEQRPVKGWYESLDRIIALEPEYIVPGHTPALKGKDNIREILTNYRDAIKYVHDEVIKGMNEDKTVDQLAEEIRLPKSLADLPYLQEYYGRVNWSVRGIYAKYAGWYDGHGTNLNPLPPEHRAREIIALAGGADKILLRAIELQKNGEYQLSSELCDLVITANPGDRVARLIKADNLERLAIERFNLNCFGFYISAASLERKKAAELE